MLFTGTRFLGNFSRATKKRGEWVHINGRCGSPKSEKILHLAICRKRQKFHFPLSCRTGDSIIIYGVLNFVRISCLWWNQTDNFPQQPHEFRWGKVQKMMYVFLNKPKSSFGARIWASVDIFVILCSVINLVRANNFQVF